MTSAVILAGGLGTRLRSAVPDLPKPMAPIGERPFLEHQLDYWIKQGVSDFVLSIGMRSSLSTSAIGIKMQRLIVLSRKLHSVRVKVFYWPLKK